MLIERVQQCLKTTRQLGWDWQATLLLEEINEGLETLQLKEEVSPIETALIGILKKYKYLLLEALQEYKYL